LSPSGLYYVLALTHLLVVDFIAGALLRSYRAIRRASNDKSTSTQASRRRQDGTT